jgi:hypothetical protein
MTACYIVSTLNEAEDALWKIVGDSVMTYARNLLALGMSYAEINEQIRSQIPTINAWLCTSRALIESRLHGHSLH